MIDRRSLMALTLASSALPFAARSAKAQAPSVLRVAPETLTRILDPHFTTSFTTRDFGYLVYDTLFAVDDRFDPKPQMVDTYTLSDDKLTWKSSAPNVARIASDGRLTAVAPGKATITAGSGQATGTLAVTVVANNIATLEVSPAAVTARLRSSGRPVRIYPRPR